MKNYVGSEIGLSTSSARKKKKERDNDTNNLQGNKSSLEEL